MNGYEIMKQIKSSTKYWKPTTGAVYPTLDGLRRKGLIRIEEKGERSQKVYALTAKGEALAMQISEGMRRRLRDQTSRRAMDSLMWPDEDEKIRDAFERLNLEVFDFRECLRKSCKDNRSVSKAMKRIDDMISELRRGRKGIKI
jgi:DNA-binding PadR family transcriptional regulator